MPLGERPGHYPGEPVGFPHRPTSMAPDDDSDASEAGTVPSSEAEMVIVTESLFGDACPSVPLVRPAQPDRLVRIKSILDTHQFRFQNEAELQAGIANILSAYGETFTREASLGDAGRIDFLLDDGIGMEVKVDGSLSDVTRQLHRYAQREEILAIILATSRALHTRLPSSFNGKRIVLVYLARSVF